MTTKTDAKSTTLTLAGWFALRQAVEYNPDPEHNGKITTTRDSNLALAGWSALEALSEAGMVERLPNVEGTHGGWYPCFRITDLGRATFAATPKPPSRRAR